MTQVIYIDVLVIINIYIGYALLRLAGIICSSEIKRLRILASSALQGLFSLVILLPPVSVFIRLPVRVAVCGLFILVAFGFYSKREFLRLYAAFILLSFAFAGVMMTVFMLRSPSGMSYNNGAVYFSIDALTLTVSTAACYALSRLIYAITKRRYPKGNIYSLTIHCNAQSIRCRALLDSGNSLCDPFSSLPVIIIDESVCKKLFGDTTDLEVMSQLPGFRLIPCTTVSSQGILPAFRPQSITIESLSIRHTTDAVYIGVSRSKIGGGEFDALIGSRVIENASERKISEDDTVYIGKQKNTQDTK